MASNVPGLGVDFGTSNTAAGDLQDGRPRLISFARGQTTIPTTFFFDFDTRRMLIGEPANQALLEGVHGRFMRALKRILGTPLMHEPRQLLNERVTFVDIIARFLAQVKARAETEAGVTFDRVLSGRPAICRPGHGPNPTRPQFSTTGGGQRQAAQHVSPASRAVSAHWTIDCDVAPRAGGTGSL